ncbi:hypothetical protein [Streptomyces sp. NPDC001978]|uniref:hypothetical protein n=1 Tax=Streptomyces sp. NPDC001978 TaxID=3364627 RepID=UPI0036C21F5E
MTLVLSPSGRDLNEDAEAAGIVRARDYDADGGPLSLLRLSSGLDCRVVVIDRPRYGHIRGLADTEATTPVGQAEILGVHVLREECPHTLIFLIGYLLGSCLAVRATAREAAGLVAGIDVLRALAFFEEVLAMKAAVPLEVVK